MGTWAPMRMGHWMWREVESWSRRPGGEEVRGGRGGAQPTSVFCLPRSVQGHLRGVGRAYGSCLGHMWGSTWPAVLSGRVLLTPLCFPPSAIMSLTTRWPSCRNGTMRALVLCSGGPKVIKGRGRACVWGWVSGWQRLNTAWGVFCFASALFPASPLATCLALPACLTPAPLPASPLASFLLYPSSP